MATDLTPEDPVSALVPTGQQSHGTLHSSRDAAMTAPGTVPALSGDNPDRPGPHVEPVTHEPANRVSGG